MRLDGTFSENTSDSNRDRWSTRLVKQDPNSQQWVQQWVEPIAA